MVNNRFGKSERLCSERIIDTLFHSGKSFLVYPIKVVWFLADSLPEDVPVQVAFSVPKRNFRRAHDRNRIKRLMREAYRIQKATWLEQIVSDQQKLAVMFVFVAKESLDYSLISNSMTKVLDRLLPLINQPPK